MDCLNGLTIIDLTQGPAGAFCSLQLADFGARVIKVELPDGGDEGWRLPSQRNGRSGYFADLNRNKESVALDYTRPESADPLRQLLQTGDLLVDAFSLRALETIGLDEKTLRREQPSLILASVTAFGRREIGLPEGDDTVVQAMSGIQAMTGFPDGRPCRIGSAVSDSIGGLNAALGILLAHFHRMETGEGQSVDVAQLDSVFGMLEANVLSESLLGEEGERCGNNDASTLVPYDVYRCADGYFSAGLAGDAGWDRFCGALGMPELEKDSRFASNELRCGHYEEFTAVVTPFFRDKTREELQTIFSKANIPCAPVLSVAEILAHPQLKARDMLLELPEGGGIRRSIGNPMKLDRTPAEFRRPAPELGQDTQAILGALPGNL